MGDELVEAATPGEPLVGGACGLGVVGIDAHGIQALYHLLRAEHLVHAFCSTAHQEVVDLLVERLGVGEHTVVGGLQVEAEDGTAEGSHIGELVEVGEHDVEGLVATP